MELQLAVQQIQQPTELAFLYKPCQQMGRPRTGVVHSRSSLSLATFSGLQLTRLFISCILGVGKARLTISHQTLKSHLA
jgi:hypothetical protein